MDTIKGMTSLYWVLLLLFGMSALLPQTSFATLSQTEASTAPLCGKVAAFHGEVQILDASRTRLTEVLRGASVGCGSFISVPKEGWVRIQHRDGVTLTLSSRSFAELGAPNSEKRDGLTLLRGELYLRAGNGSAELQVLTGNARVKLGQGSALLSFDDEKEETQVLSFQRPLVIENRYQSGTAVKVGPGETSSLDFKILRITPSAPSAVSLASVKKRLAPFHLSDREVEMALNEVRARQDRKFAAVLREPIPLAGETLIVDQQRVPASEMSKPGKLVPEEMFETLSPSEISIAPAPEVVAPPSQQTPGTPAAAAAVPAGSEKTQEEIADEKAQKMSKQAAERYDSSAYTRHADGAEVKQEMEERLLQKQTAQELPTLDHRSEAMVPRHETMTPQEMLFPDQFKAGEATRLPAGNGSSKVTGKGIEVIDAEARAQAKAGKGRRRGGSSEEDRERARLIQELSRMGAGDGRSEEE